MAGLAQAKASDSPGEATKRVGAALRKIRFRGLLLAHSLGPGRLGGHGRTRGTKRASRVEQRVTDGLQRVSQRLYGYNSEPLRRLQFRVDPQTQPSNRRSEKLLPAAFVTDR